MSFLDRLNPDPFYQKGEPRRPEEVEHEEPGIIVSSDTFRINRIPPGQTRTRKFPVLDAFGTPDIDLEKWAFTVDGLVENQKSWSLDEFLELPAVKVYADFHCVTRWSRLDNIWTGVSTRTIAEICGIKPEAGFVQAIAHDTDSRGQNWTTNLPLSFFLNEDSLIAFAHDGKPIPPAHGGPVRLVVPQLYAWKSAKWIKGLRFIAADEAGYWERGGYHMRGVPWNGSDGERFHWS